MELLGWLNAGSLIMQNAAAGLSSIDDSKEEFEVEVEVEEEEEEEPTNRLQVRHHFIPPLSLDLNDPSLPPSIQTIPPAEHE